MSDHTAHSDSSSFRPLGEDSTGYDPTTETFHSRFDADSESVVVAVIDAVTAVTNRDPIALSPLYETVDPEALTEIMADGRERPVEVCFSYAGCEVTVSSDGRIVVEPPAS